MALIQLIVRAVSESRISKLCPNTHTFQFEPFEAILCRQREAALIHTLYINHLQPIKHQPISGKNDSLVRFVCVQMGGTLITASSLPRGLTRDLQ